jgi:capsule polysaccharide export protein KpsC/LpsZ
MSQQPEVLLGVTSRALLRIPYLAEMLESPVIYVWAKWFLYSAGRVTPTAILGWGRRPSAKKSRELALCKGIPFIALVNRPGFRGV